MRADIASSPPFRKGAEHRRRRSWTPPPPSLTHCGNALRPRRGGTAFTDVPRARSTENVSAYVTLSTLMPAFFQTELQPLRGRGGGRSVANDSARRSRSLV
ncbi:hypothetical protein MRX96_003906 [Rhipicephalus microplus]